MVTGMTALTQAYADFAAAAAALTPPDEALHTATTGFVDATGVMLAGAREPVVDVLARWACAQGGAAQAGLAGRAQRVPAALAACVNATAAHAMDYDDFAFSNHPSAVLVPTILAAAQAGTQPVSGALALRAYIAGYEVWADAFGREKDLYYDRGWHPTAVLGTLGATVAAAVVWGLDAQRTRHALALAASSAGGVFENFGTMAKPYHGGRAAEVGVQAATLAAHGLQASPTAIEGGRGMLRAFSPQGRVDLDTPFEGGAPWRIRQYRLNLKRYPVVGAAQRGIDAMLGLRELQAVDPRRVRALVAHVSRRHYAVMPYALPQDALQAKFSLEFALCCALVHGRVGFAELRDEVVREPLLQRLMAAVHVETTEDFEPGWRDAAPFDQVFVHLDDGSVLASPQVRRPLGHADRPLDAAQVGDKFMGCTGYAGIDKTLARELHDTLWTLGTLPDVRALPWLLAG